MMGDLAALDSYDDMTRRITGRDPTVAPTTRERILDYQRSPVGQMQDQYRKAPDDIWKQADDEVMNRDLVPDVGMNLFATGPQEAPQVAKAQAQGAKDVANWVIPQSPTDAALMFAMGPFGGKLARTAVGAAGALGEMLDPAEAGVGSKVGKAARGKMGDVLKVATDLPT